MKFDSEIKLTAKDIEQIIIDHLKAKDTRGLKFKNVYFNVDGGGRDDFGGYDPARLYGASVKVELEIND